MSGHGISEHQLYSGEEPCEEFLILVNAGHALAEDIPEPLVPVHPQAPSILMLEGNCSGERMAFPGGTAGDLGQLPSGKRADFYSKVRSTSGAQRTPDRTCH